MAAALRARAFACCELPRAIRPAKVICQQLPVPRWVFACGSFAARRLARQQISLDATSSAMVGMLALGGRSARPSSVRGQHEFHVLGGGRRSRRPDAPRALSPNAGQRVLHQLASRNRHRAVRIDLRRHVVHAVAVCLRFRASPASRIRSTAAACGARPLAFFLRGFACVRRLPAVSFFDHLAQSIPVDGSLPCLR